MVAVEEEEEDAATEQGQIQVQEQQDAVPSSVNNDDTNNNNNNLLALPTAGARRTGSMEARKGSACTISGLEDVHGLQRLELGISVPQSGNGDDDAGSPADLVGVGGQFLL